MKRPGLLVGFLIVWVCSLWLAPVRHAAAQPTEYPAPLEQGVFVSDRAAVLSIESTKQINKASAEIMVATGVPVVVVTIRSVEHMGGDTYAGIEGYARELFNKWGIGNADDNRGILLLYSRGDSKVRVQLGKGWPKSQDGVAQGIVDGVIAPPIKRNATSEGLMAGVRALGAMIEADNVQRFPKRDALPRAATPGSGPASATPEVPPAPSALSVVPTWVWVGVGVVVLLVVVLFGVFALLRRRGGGGGGGMGGGDPGEGW